MFLDNLMQKHNIFDLLEPQDKEQLALAYPNTPAGVYESAVQHAIVAGAPDREGFLQALRLGIESYHEVAEGSKPRGTAKLPLQQFVVDALNIQIPGGIQGFLEQVRGADIHMRREDADPHFSFNLLFYGPSGTGKSALARYIAHILDRELMVKRASDLLSPYVGETEHHIREAFDQAKRQNAVLVLDEMDALCWDRARAVRSFESSFTSELLQALDDFGGAFFIGTTNRFEDLDMAILRRCTLKVEFTWLKSEQVLTLYDHLLAPLVPQALSEFEKQALGEIQGLTPGDMKVVRDRLVLASSSSLTHATVIASLREEVRIRGIRAGSNHPLGF